MYIEAFNADPESHMPITVFSGGYAFSGRLVGASVYFDAVADRADIDAVSIPFRKMAEDYRSEPADDTPLVTTYVHMLDVRRLLRSQAPRQAQGLARPTLTDQRLDHRAHQPQALGGPRSLAASTDPTSVVRSASTAASPVVVRRTTTAEASVSHAG